MPTSIIPFFGQAPPYALEPTLWASIWFLAGLVVLDLFDISLPRGDSVGVAGALAAASLVVLGPAQGAVLVGISAVGVHLLRRGLSQPLRLVGVLISRIAGIVAAASVLAVGASVLPPLALYGIVPAAFLMVEIITAQAVTGVVSSRSFLRLVRGNIRSQAPLLAAQWSASVLLLLTYNGMGGWSLIPVVALLLLMRQSYALFLDIRETYRTTVEVLVEAAENQDARRVGHADRTAMMARAIAGRLGLGAAMVERISYAALLHDLGTLSDRPQDGPDPVSRSMSSADVVHGVEFFRDVEPILRACDGPEGAANAVESDLTAAMIVALASDIDMAFHPEVAAAHKTTVLDDLAPMVSPTVKARVVGAALELGYRTPAVR
ncbi:MAG: HD domain-containing protein [Coriobacteriia bacterium]|nr:HD domain-containing protein [Coriobacteriia bacterium]